MAQVSVGRNHPFGAIGTPDAPRRTGFGSAGVLEVVEDHRGDTYRAVYTVKFAAPQRATQSAPLMRGDLGFGANRSALNSGFTLGFSVFCTEIEITRGMQSLGLTTHP